MNADPQRIIWELTAIRAELDELACRIGEITLALRRLPPPERRVDPPAP